MGLLVKNGEDSCEKKITFKYGAYRYLHAFLQKKNTRVRWIQSKRLIGEISISRSWWSDLKGL